jgi:hypothetical protein
MGRVSEEASAATEPPRRRAVCHWRDHRARKLPRSDRREAHRDDIDLVKRHLDCAVVNFVHLLRERERLDPFDTVRGVFTEGGELYPGAKILAKTHVQVCVRNPKKSIKGYFRPLTYVA